MALTYNFGTNSVLDTLAAQRTLIANYGEDRAFESVQMALEAHNRIMDEMLADLTDRSTDRLRRYGGTTLLSMQQLDEFGTPNPQKILAGVNVGFPLYTFQAGLQWTKKYMQNATTYEIAAQAQVLMQADVTAVQRQIKVALFTPTNNLTYTDSLVDNLTVPLRALVNADGAGIPPDPYGTVFDGATHTHYLGTSSLVVGDVIGLIETVVEHRLEGQVLLYINRAQEAAVRAMTGFNAYQDVRVLPATTITIGRGALNPDTLYNRAIGVIGAAEVWVKPWVPSGYMLAYRAGMAPLVFRYREGGNGDLAIVWEDNAAHPLTARVVEREFGVGVWNRTEAAVLDTAHSSYTAPTL